METLREILTQRQFQIPANQRGYSWGKEQAKAVIDDLDLATRNGNAHYFGPLVVTGETTEGQDGGEANRYILDDGQQRLTTCLLLLFAIRRTASTKTGGASELESEIGALLFCDDDQNEIRIQVGQSDLNQFLRHILLGEEQPRSRVSAMRRLEEVYTYYLQEVGNYTEHQLNRLLERLLDRAKFILVDLGAEQIDRHLTFDAINSRGVSLSEFDKIKNFAILLNSLRDGLDFDAESEWYRSLVELERFGVASTLEEEAFIAEVFSLFFNRSISNSKVHEEFVRIFGSLLNNEHLETERRLQNFVEFWAVYARAFGFVTCWDRDTIDPTLANAEARSHLANFDKLNKTAISRKLLCASLIKYDDDDFAKVSALAEAYSFRTRCIPFGNSNQKNTHGKELLQLASAVYKGDVACTELRDRVGELAKQRGSLGRVFDFLVDGREKYAGTSPPWPYIYYFLYQYEVSLHAPEDERPKYETSDDQQIASIDFILPEAVGDSDEWWTEHWPHQSERDRHSLRIGNLVLTNEDLEESPASYPDKVERIYSQPGATRSEQKLCEYSRDAWGPKQIREREIDLVKFALKRWIITDHGTDALFEFPAEFGDPTEDPHLVIDLSEFQA